MPFGKHCLKKKDLFENAVGKGENAGGYHYFLFLPQCFLAYERQICSE